MSTTSLLSFDDFKEGQVFELGRPRAVGGGDQDLRGRLGSAALPYRRRSGGGKQLQWPLRQRLAYRLLIHADAGGWPPVPLQEHGIPGNG